MLRLIFLAVQLLLLSADLLPAQVTSAPAKKLDLSFIPEDALAAIVANPRKVLTSPQAALWPTEVLSAAAKTEVGFDPMEIEQVIGIIGMPQPGGGPPAFGAIVRFRQPIDADAMAAKIVKHGADEKIEGKRARVAISQFEPSLAFADDRTVLVAFAQNLPWMLSAKKADSPLQKLLASVDSAPTVAAYTVLEPVRPLISQALPQLQQSVPPMFRDLVNLPMSIDNVRISADLLAEPASGVGLNVRLGTADAETAKQVANVLKRALKDGKEMWIAQMSQAMERDQRDPELKAAMFHYARRLADFVLASLDPKPEGSDAVVKVELRAGMTEVGVLSALLLPAVQSAREAARRAQSMNNLKQIGLSLHNYHSVNKRFPSSATFDGNGKPLLSWRVYMLPYLEETALYEQFHLDEPWDSEHNIKLVDKMPAVFRHPGLEFPNKTVYQAIVGKGAAFEDEGGLPLRAFTDGTSNTVVVAEVAPEKAVPWTKPEDWKFDPEKQINLGDFGGVWRGGMFQVVYADGSVRVIESTIDPATLKAIFTRNGGEPIRAP